MGNCEEWNQKFFSIAFHHTQHSSFSTAEMWNGLNSPLLLYRCVVIDSSFECVSQLLAPFERESCPFHHVVPTQLIELTTRHSVTGRMCAGLLDYDKQQIACIEILADSWQSRMQNVFHVHINSYGKTVKNVVVLRRPMLMLMCRGSSATALLYIYRLVCISLQACPEGEFHIYNIVKRLNCSAKRWRCISTLSGIFNNFSSAHFYPSFILTINYFKLQFLLTHTHRMAGEHDAEQN